MDIPSGLSADGQMHSTDRQSLTNGRQSPKRTVLRGHLAVDIPSELSTDAQMQSTGRQSPSTGRQSPKRGQLSVDTSSRLSADDQMQSTGRQNLSPTGRQSPKPTLLRDQHLPGETLHRKTAFPADIHTRHEAACANPDADKQAVASPSHGADGSQLGTADDSGKLLLATSRQFSSASSTGKNPMQQTLSSLQRQPMDSTAGSAHSKAQLADVALVDAAPVPTDSIKSSRLSGSAHRSAIGTRWLQDTATKPVVSQSSVAEPWFEATTHDLARNSTWAKEWLAVGAEEAEANSSDFAELLQQSAHEQSVRQQQSAMQQSGDLNVAKQQPLQQHSGQQQPMRQQSVQRQSLQQQSTQQQQPLTGTPRRLTPRPPQASTSQQLDMQTTPKRSGQQISTEHAALQSARTSRSLQTHSRILERECSNAGSQDLSLAAESQHNGAEHSRPWTAPGSSLFRAAGMEWVQDAGRLRSARPGCGGSPTAR